MEEIFELYTLIKKDVAIISNNKITNISQIEQIGGEKLVYQRYYITYLSFMLFKKRIKIPIKKQKVGTIVLYKPLKRYWDKNTNRISHVMWGKMNRQLTQFWIKMNGDYTNIQSDYISKDIQRVRIYANTRIIKILNSHPEKFIIEIGLL